MGAAAFRFVFADCLLVQNILVDHHCQCKDLFLCPHYGESGYGVFISDFGSAQQVDRGRGKLERVKLHGQPIKYSVCGTPGYQPPEVSDAWELKYTCALFLGFYGSVNVKDTGT